jgi:hypothetical protein
LHSANAACQPATEYEPQSGAAVARKQILNLFILCIIKWRKSCLLTNKVVIPPIHFRKRVCTFFLLENVTEIFASKWQSLKAVVWELVYGEGSI